MATVHGFCSLHRIAYNRTLDAHCPQCVLGGVQDAPQYDWESAPPVLPSSFQTITDPATGTKLDPITLKPVQ